MPAKPLAPSKFHQLHGLLEQIGFLCVLRRLCVALRCNSLPLRSQARRLAPDLKHESPDSLWPTASLNVKVADRHPCETWWHPW